jgi:two-component system response regulator YesN
MPKLSGLELMEQVRKAGLPCEMVVLSGYSEFEYARAAIELRVFDYCVKPVDSELADHLLTRLENHLEKTPRLSVEAPQPTAPVKNAQFQKLLDYINVNFAEQMHITKLSKMFYINTSYCCKLFDQTFGMNFSAYVKDVRMKNAKTFLEAGCTVKETAQITGYTDYFYFTKAYKKYYSVTPSEYRKKCLAGAEPEEGAAIDEH